MMRSIRNPAYRHAPDPDLIDQRLSPLWRKVFLRAAHPWKVDGGQPRARHHPSTGGGAAMSMRSPGRGMANRTP